MRIASSMLSVALAVLTSTAGVHAVEMTRGRDPAAAMFERMHALAGDWTGTYEWSGGRTDAGSLRATYYVTGMGSALVEDLIIANNTPSMTTVYHLDGPDLRMTHFCAAQNQPRLKAAVIDLESGLVNFSLVDVTNAVDHPSYVEGLSLHVVDADNLVLKFAFGGKSDKKALETIVLRRVRASSPSS